MTKQPPQYGKAEFAAVAIVLNEFDEVLAVTRRGAPTDWAVPGGKRDPGESLKRCAARELEEETGVTADEDSMELVFSGYDAHDNEVYAFLVRRWTGDPRRQEEGVHVGWLRPVRLLEKSCTFHEFNRQVIVEKLAKAA